VVVRCAGAFLLALSAWPTDAASAPQASASVTAGVSANGDAGGLFRSAGASFGLRGDLLLLRDSPKSVGLGPYLEALTTSWFADGQLGAGVTALLPVHPLVPIACSMGLYERRDASGWAPGAAGALFVGSRSYNYHGSYSMTAGVLVEARRGLTSAHDTSFVLALDVDLELVGLPFLILFEALR
jgi:hypothetical protein